MTPLVDIELPGEPAGKGRPRSTRTGRHYTPEKTRSYESMVKAAAFEAMAGRPPSQEPISIVIEAFFSIPKTMKKLDRAKAEMEKLPVTKKPDGDNIAKIILDPMNKIVFDDDSQAWNIHVLKLYSPRPRVRVRVLP